MSATIWQRIAAIFGGSTRTTILVRVDNVVAGQSFDWGQEADEFMEAVIRITRSLGGHAADATRADTGLELLLQVARFEAWREKVDTLAASTAVGVAVSLFERRVDREHAAGVWSALPMSDRPAAIQRHGKPS